MPTFDHIPAEITARILSYFSFEEKRTHRLVNKQFKAMIEENGWFKTYGMNYPQVINMIQNVLHAVESDRKHNEDLLKITNTVATHIQKNDCVTQHNYALLILALEQVFKSHPDFYSLLVGERYQLDQYPNRMPLLMALQSIWIKKMQKYHIATIHPLSDEEMETKLNRLTALSEQTQDNLDIEIFKQIKNDIRMLLPALLHTKSHDALIYSSSYLNNIDAYTDLIKHILDVVMFVSIEEIEVLRIKTLQNSGITCHPQQLQDVTHRKVDAVHQSVINDLIEKLDVTLDSVQLNTVIARELNQGNFSNVKYLKALGAVPDSNQLNETLQKEITKLVTSETEQLHTNRIYTLQGLGATVTQVQLNSLLQQATIDCFKTAHIDCSKDLENQFDEVYTEEKRRLLADRLASEQQQKISRMHLHSRFC